MLGVFGEGGYDAEICLYTHGMRVFDWLRRSSDDESSGDDEVSENMTADQALVGLREYAVGMIRPGFTDLDSILEAVHDSNDDEEVVLDASIVDQMVREEWNKRLAELSLANEKNLGNPDDYTRLSAAFSDLEKQGIVARMNFTCCQTCGHAEIDDERGHEETEIGYVFFHQQDTERVADGDSSLYFAFGMFPDAPGIDQVLLKKAIDGDEDSDREIHEVVQARELTVANALKDALTAHGFSVAWDGTVQQRPSVLINDWRKPLPQ